MATRLDLTGQHFGKLIVLSFAGINHRQNTLWLCQCDCGNRITTIGTALRAKHIKSCGCLQYLPKTPTHGMKHTQTYNCWNKMKQRCLNPKNPAYPRYGGKGITICPQWLQFEHFFADMGIQPPGLSLDRIDNNGNYEPENCRWATPREQVINRHTTRYITYNGITQCLEDWAITLGIAGCTLSARLKRMSLKRALTLPKQISGKVHK